MTDTATIATMTDYEGLIEAFRMIRVARGLSYSTVDELGGLTAGHSEKVLGPSMTKGLSPMMFETLCGVFAVKLQMVDDVDAAKRMEHRWERRFESNVRTSASSVSKKIIERAKPAVLRAHMQNARAKRNITLSPKKRSAIARKAAKAKHKKHRMLRRQLKRSPSLVPA